MKIKNTTKFKKSVGKRLRAHRKSIGLNIVGFAEKIRISIGALSELENGISAPSARTLANLHLLTDVDIGWLLTGKLEQEVRPQKSAMAF